MNLHDYDGVLINTSGGKDSQTAMRVMVKMADQQEYSRDRMVAAHADLGRMEWPGVKELAAEQADHYGLQFVVVKYRNKDGEPMTLLDYVRKRGKWPSSTTRYCTSEFKRGPCSRIITAMSRRMSGEHRILNVFGFRAEESPARAKRSVLTRNGRLSTKLRTVDDYLPIHGWTSAQVWSDIQESGVRHHKAYDIGMPRLSCCFCIFAPRPALIVAGLANPKLLGEYVAVEQEIGHRFRVDLSLQDVAQAIAAGESPGAMNGNWNM
jgi:3'-phosphoadenosine 5'-phosphosulfate sulfotransferase (PAPS reductase)/FAD synthetase